MQIKTVQIKNFRTLEDVEINFNAVTTLIGPNGAGKSSVLRALDWYFNGRGGPLSERDLTFGNHDQEIEVQVTFDQLTENDRQALGKYAPAGAKTFTAWKTWSKDKEEKLSANTKSFPLFNEIKLASSVAEMKQLYSEIRGSNPSFQLPIATTRQAMEEAVASWEASNLDKLELSPESISTNFFGFYSAGKMRGLFDFVFVPADLRASEEAADAKSSIIGRILEQSIDRSLADEKIEEIVRESQKRQRLVYESAFKSQLEEIMVKLNKVVNSYSPGREVIVSPTNFEIKSPKTTFDLSILDGTTETDVERQGHGFQRTLLVSALQLLAQSSSESSGGVVCLAIEEPELFQHPIQAQAFAKVLRSLAEDKSKRMQISYATHSPYFIEAQHFDQIRRLTRSAETNSTTSVYSANFDDVRERLAGIADETRVKTQLDNVLTRDLAVALFANRALVVEGSTESAVLSAICDRVTPGALDAAGISIVPANGKDCIPLAHAILSALEIPVYALFDADAGFETRSFGKTQKTIDEERASHIRSNRKLLRYFELEEVDFPSEKVEISAAILGDQLEEFLRLNWREWGESLEKVQQVTGIRAKKNSQVYRQATLSAEGDAPAFLQDVIRKASSF